MKNKIDNDQIAIAYQLAQAIYSGELPLINATEIAQDYGMNPESAKIYFNILKKLITGMELKRTISVESFDYFLNNIYSDYGLEVLKKSLDSIKAHISYFEEVESIGKMKKLTNLYNKYLDVYTNDSSLTLVFEEMEDYTFTEGNEMYKLHRIKERNKELIKIAKMRYHKTNTNLSCQVCGFSFSNFYGDIGKGFIEAHHIVPMSQLTVNSETRIEEIAFLCSNCHTMVHKQNPCLSIESLKSLIIK